MDFYYLWFKKRSKLLCQSLQLPLSPYYSKILLFKVWNQDKSFFCGNTFNNRTLLITSIMSRERRSLEWSFPYRNWRELSSEPVLLLWFCGHPSSLWFHQDQGGFLTFLLFTQYMRYLICMEYEFLKLLLCPRIGSQNVKCELI